MGNQKEIEQFDQLLREHMQDFQPAPPPGVLNQVLSQAGAGATASGTGWTVVSKWIVGTCIVAATSGGFYYFSQQEQGNTEPKQEILQNNIDPSHSSEDSPESISPKAEDIDVPANTPEVKTPKAPQYASNQVPVSNAGATLPSQNPSNQEPLIGEPRNTNEKSGNHSGKSDQNGHGKSNYHSAATAPEFGYQWIDDYRIVLSLKKMGVGQLAMHINGLPSEMVPEDGGIISLDKEGFPTQVVFKSENVQTIDSFIMKIQYPSEDQLKVPNAFTPDGDGINDVYNIAAPLYIDYTMRVLDINNRIIFEGHNWDGTEAGKPSDPGTYHVIIRYKTPTSGWLSKQLNIQLIRN